MNLIKYKVEDGICITPCPHWKQLDNEQYEVYKVGSFGCKCECEHFEGVRKSQNIVYCKHGKKQDSNKSGVVTVRVPDKEKFHDLVNTAVSVLSENRIQKVNKNRLVLKAIEFYCNKIINKRCVSAPEAIF